MTTRETKAFSLGSLSLLSGLLLSVPTKTCWAPKKGTRTRVTRPEHTNQQSTTPASVFSSRHPAWQELHLLGRGLGTRCWQRTERLLAASLFGVLDLPLVHEQTQI